MSTNARPQAEISRPPVKVEITLTPACGPGTQISIDGHDITRYLRKLEVVAEVGTITSVVLHVIPGLVRLHADGAALWIQEMAEPFVGDLR